MALRIAILTAAVAVTSVLAPAAGAAAPLRPPIVWLKGEGNFTKAHRSPRAIDRIVVHVTEGAFWGSVRWLKNPRAHASSHYVVARSGKIVQIVHTSDIAWHAGNWRINRESVGIEHEGFTYGPGGFTDAQYRNSARLAAWLARRSLMPIDRTHIIGHSQVPAPGGGYGGSSHHTDPGPHWNWQRYLALVRAYAHGDGRLSVVAAVPPSPLRGVIPWRADTRGGVRRVEFAVNGRVVWVDRQAPFAFAGGRGLNTVPLGNGRHVLELRAYGDGTRHDVTRRSIVVANRAFAITTAGARPWTKVQATLQLRSRVWGAKAVQVAFKLDGKLVLVDRKAPYVLGWNSRRVRDGRHLLEVVATAADGRVASRRIPVVVSNRPVVRPQPKPVVVPLRIVSQTVANGQVATGLVLWRVETAGPVARVEFLVDGVLHGADVAAPYTLGWNAGAETSGEHALTARVHGRSGRVVEAKVTLSVPPPTPSGSATP